MSEPELSPLAQKLAESHDVDLDVALPALYDQNPEGKITARNVLEFLSLTVEEEALVERQLSRGKKEKKVGKAVDNSELKKSPEVTQLEGVGRDLPERSRVAPEPPKVEESEPVPPSAASKEAQKALNQTRSQLQATAMVHQKALMQVGSLRQKNEALDMEVGRLKSKEAAARAFIQELEEKQRNLERELEASRKKPKPLEWLRKKLF